MQPIFGTRTELELDYVTPQKPSTKNNELSYYGN
jgi:hypothetical protein